VAPLTVSTAAVCFARTLCPSCGAAELEMACECASLFWSCTAWTFTILPPETVTLTCAGP
jgi:hypothetical protein